MAVRDLQNEADVREEIATPFLRTLGYARGTENDIERERALRYEALQLGRKKSNDQPLGGKADYLLTVAGAGRWVLETKPPYEEIDLDTIDQTISYARHPEVCGHYAAVLNGRRFVLFDRSKSSNDAPLLDLAVSSGEALAVQLQNLLSPAAIRRDCGPPIVDLSEGLAPGFRSKIKILGGEIHHLGNHWDFPSYIPDQFRDATSAQTAKLKGYISNVGGGLIWRDEQSRIRVKLDWALPHEELGSFMEASRIGELEYVCLDSTISDDPEKPSIFEVLGNFHLEAGQRVYNVLQWTSQVMQLPLEATVLCQATGFLRDGIFAGIASLRQIMRTPPVPDPIQMISELQFSARVDTR